MSEARLNTFRDRINSVRHGLSPLALRNMLEQTRILQDEIENLVYTIASEKGMVNDSFVSPLKVRIIITSDESYKAFIGEGFKNVASYGLFCGEKPQYIYFEPNIMIVNTIIDNLTKDNKKSDKTVVKIPYNIIMDDKNEKIRALELKMELTFIH